jgi:hypothetical protein
MLRLNVSLQPRWIDLGHGVRLKVAPLTTAVMLAARKNPEVLAVTETEVIDENQVASVFAKVIAQIVIDEWEGIGDDDGKPVSVTPEGINALMEMWPIFEAFQEKYMADGMLLESEKNVSSPLPNGSTAGAKDIAKPARKPAKSARRKKTSR